MSVAEIQECFQRLREQIKVVVAIQDEIEMLVRKSAAEQWRSTPPVKPLSLDELITQRRAARFTDSSKQ
jgi:hypothetical protein